MKTSTLGNLLLVGILAVGGYLIYKKIVDSKTAIDNAIGSGGGAVDSLVTGSGSSAGDWTSTGLDWFNTLQRGNMAASTGMLGVLGVDMGRQAIIDAVNGIRLNVWAGSTGSTVFDKKPDLIVGGKQYPLSLQVDTLQKGQWVSYSQNGETISTANKGTITRPTSSITSIVGQATNMSPAVSGTLNYYTPAGTASSGAGRVNISSGGGIIRTSSGSVVSSKPQQYVGSSYVNSTPNRYALISSSPPKK